MKHKPLTALRQILQTAARSLGVERAAHEAMIQEMWSAVVGAEVAAHARPAGLRGGTLLVEVEPGLWVQELSARRAGIAGELNRRLGADVVQDLRLRPARGAVPPQRVPTPPAAASPEELTAEDAADIERTVAAIADPELREATRHAMASQRRWRRVQARRVGG